MEQTGSPHLTADEIAGVLAGSAAGGMAADRAAHASTCEDCRRIIGMHEEEDLRLQRLAGGPRNGPTKGCPPPSEWASLAAGLVEAPRSDELLAHASLCDACGAMLHALVEDFSDDVTEEESKSLGGLQSATPVWQRQMAGRMAQARRPGRVISMPVKRWLQRAAAVIVTVGAGWLAWQQWMVSDPARLIAKAYTQQRPFEFRIPEAGHAGVRVERGGAGSSFQRPPALLEAEAKIARELEKNPESVKWLALRARAEMMGWDPETAIGTLQRALDRTPDNPDLLADLGMAYALRAEAQSRDVDYGYAIEYLGRSLKAKPNAPEVIFNRAVVYERMYLYDQAEQEWRRYLELDSAGAWHDEAQRRLRELDVKKKSGRPR